MFIDGCDCRPRLTDHAAEAAERHADTQAIVPPVSASGAELLALSRIGARPEAV